jgi:hypothetical protein
MISIIIPDFDTHCLRLIPYAKTKAKIDRMIVLGFFVAASGHIKQAVSAIRLDSKSCCANPRLKRFQPPLADC